ncbi:hypothetical protein O4H62_21080 [Hoeflea alexandrii]|nr:hypothetical protein [Hoeflea alexandrii]
MPFANSRMDDVIGRRDGCQAFGSPGVSIEDLTFLSLISISIVSPSF